jgi:prepilin-type N-terminal cleavage/methylation domain-containing protein
MTDRSQRHSSGFTFLEVLVTLSIMGIMMAGGAVALSRYGADGRVSHEANKVADLMWELRAQATMGQQFPCIDFPDNQTVRVYNDLNATTNGYTAGADSLKQLYTYGGGVKYTAISGGGGSTHYLCFDSRGVKTGTSILKVTLAAGSGRPVVVQMSPATSIPKVIK